MNRRELFGAVLPPLALSTSKIECARGQARERQYSLLLKGGTVIDTSQGLNAARDLAIADGKIAAIESNIPAEQAARTINVSGQFVTPGLVDIHVHGFEGVSHWGLNLDGYCVPRGVTTAVDAGTAGADNFDGFRRLNIDHSRTRVLAFLNISRVGLVGAPGELIDPRMIDGPAALRAAEKHEDVIVGIKVRCGNSVSGPNDILALRTARKTGDAIRKPVMVHVGSPRTPTDQILNELRAGDMLTHSFRAPGTGGVAEAGAKIPDYVLKARDRGVLFDVGHGSGALSFAAAEAALKAGLAPTSISSDLHAYSALGPVFDLATTMSKFLLLGVSLERVVELATAAPARAIGRAALVGSIMVGRAADVAIFDLVQGNFTFVDSTRAIRKFHQKLVPVLALRDGRLP
jgi:dihydroorotase